MRLMLLIKLSPFLRAQGFDVVEAKPEIDGIKLMENYYTIAAGSAGVAEYLGNQILKKTYYN